MMRGVYESVCVTHEFFYGVYGIVRGIFSIVHGVFGIFLPQWGEVRRGLLLYPMLALLVDFAEDEIEGLETDKYHDSAGDGEDIHTATTG